MQRVGFKCGGPADIPYGKLWKMGERTQVAALYETLDDWLFWECYQPVDETLHEQLEKKKKP